MAFDVIANIIFQNNVDVVAKDIQNKLSGIKANISIDVASGTENKLKGLQSNLDGISTKMKELEALGVRVSNSFKQMGESLNQTRTAAQSLAKGQAEIVKATTEFIDNTTKLSDNLKKVTSAQNAQAEASKKTKKEIREAGNVAAEFGHQAFLAARRYAAFTVAMTAGFGVFNRFKDGIRQAVEFQDEIVKITQVSGKTVAQLNPLIKQIDTLSTTLGVSSKELADVSLVLVQAGLSAKETEQALKVLAKVSLLPTFEGMKGSVEGVIAVMGQFGAKTKDLEQIFSIINSVSAKYAVESEDIITAIRRTGASFAQLKTDGQTAVDSISEFVALFTSIRSTTRESAETIATGLRTIFPRLQRRSTIEALRDLGIEVSDTKGKFIGLYPAITKIGEALKNLDPKDIRFASIIEELGGIRQINKTIPLFKEIGLAQEALNLAKSKSNSLDEDAGKKQQSLLQQYKVVGEQFLGILRDIGASSAFKDLNNSILIIIKGFNNLFDTIKPIVPYLTTLAAIKIFPGIKDFGRGFGQKIVPKFRDGGYIPGVGDRDSELIAAMPGEFILNKKAARTLGPDVLHRLNNAHQIKGFSRGGLVGLPGAGTTQLPGAGTTQLPGDGTTKIRAYAKGGFVEEYLPTPGQKQSIYSTQPIFSSKMEAGVMYEEAIRLQQAFDAELNMIKDALAFFRKTIEGFNVSLTHTALSIKTKDSLGAYSANNKKVFINSKSNYADFGTLIHELAHMVDNAIGEKLQLENPYDKDEPNRFHYASQNPVLYPLFNNPAAKSLLKEYGGDRPAPYYRKRVEQFARIVEYLPTADKRKDFYSTLNEIMSGYKADRPKPDLSSLFEIIKEASVKATLQNDKALKEKNAGLTSVVLPPTPPNKPPAPPGLPPAAPPPPPPPPDKNYYDIRNRPNSGTPSGFGAGGGFGYSPFGTVRPYGVQYSPQPVTPYRVFKRRGPVRVGGFRTNVPGPLYYPNGMPTPEYFAPDIGSKAIPQGPFNQPNFPFNGESRTTTGRIRQRGPGIFSPLLSGNSDLNFPQRVRLTARNIGKAIGFTRTPDNSGQRFLSNLLTPGNTYAGGPSLGLLSGLNKANRSLEIFETTGKRVGFANTGVGRGISRINRVAGNPAAQYGAAFGAIAAQQAFGSSSTNAPEKARLGAVGDVAAGGLTGFATGAALGSAVLPGIGTAVGAVTGALVGLTGAISSASENIKNADLDIAIKKFADTLDPNKNRTTNNLDLSNISNSVNASSFINPATTPVLNYANQVRMFYGGADDTAGKKTRSISATAELDKLLKDSNGNFAKFAGGFTSVEDFFKSEQGNKLAKQYEQIARASDANAIVTFTNIVKQFVKDGDNLLVLSDKISEVVTGFEELTSQFKSINTQLAVFDTQIENSSNLVSGRAGFKLADRSDLISNPSRVTDELRNQLIGNTLGAAGASKLTGTAQFAGFAQSRARELAIALKPGTGLEGENATELGNKAVDTLVQDFTKNNPNFNKQDTQVVEQVLRRIVNQDTSTKDLDQLQKEINSALAPINTSVSELSKLQTSRLNSLVSNTVTGNAFQISGLQGALKTRELGIEQTDTARRFSGLNPLTGAAGGAATFGFGANVQQRFLGERGGLRGNDVFSASAIGNRLNELNTQQQGFNEFTPAADIVENTTQMQYLTAALETLDSNTTKQNSLLQREIDFLQARKDEQLGFAERASTSTGSELNKMLRGAALAQQVSSGKTNLFDLSRKDRELALREGTALNKTFNFDTVKNAQLAQKFGINDTDLKNAQQQLLNNLGIQANVQGVRAQQGLQEGQNIVNVAQQQFNLGADLANFNNRFENAIAMLDVAAAKIPNEIALNGTINLDISINGAEALASMEPKFRELIDARVSDSIDKLVGKLRAKAPAGPGLNV